MGILRLTTRARVKALMEIGGQAWSNADPALETQLIPAVSMEIAKDLGRELLIEEREEDFDVRAGQAMFLLRAFPVVAVASVKVDAAREFGDGTELEASDYFVNRRLGYLQVDRVSLPCGPGVLRVTYTGGIATVTEASATPPDGEVALPDVAPDLMQAAELQIAYTLQRRNNLGGTIQTGGGAQTQYQGEIDLLAGVRRKLDRYRRRTHG